MCDFAEYTAERAARDAMTIQTSIGGRAIEWNRQKLRQRKWKKRQWMKGSIMRISKNVIHRNDLIHLDQSHHQVIRQVSAENVIFAVMIHAPATRKASYPLKGKGVSSAKRNTILPMPKFAP